MTARNNVKQKTFIINDAVTLVCEVCCSCVVRSAVAGCCVLLCQFTLGAESSMKSVPCLLCLSSAHSLLPIVMYVYVYTLSAVSLRESRRITKFLIEVLRMCC